MDTHEEEEVEQEVEEYMEAARGNLKTKENISEVIDAFNNSIPPMTPMEY
ncbi:hypothetical protein [Desnuesiella massiliensis]|nr:hypothetical protein [Desnuesiella massiliensis]